MPIPHHTSQPSSNNLAAYLQLLFPISFLCVANVIFCVLRLWPLAFFVSTLLLTLLYLIKSEYEQSAVSAASNYTPPPPLHYPPPPGRAVDVFDFTAAAPDVGGGRARRRRSWQHVRHGSIIQEVVIPDDVGCSPMQ